MVCIQDELLNRSSCIGLSYFSVTLQEVAQETHEVLQVLVRKLVSEHVQELDTGRFEDRQHVDVLLLKLWNRQTLNVLIQSLHGDGQIVGSFFVVILTDAGSNQ